MSLDMSGGSDNFEVKDKEHSDSSTEVFNPGGFPSSPPVQPDTDQTAIGHPPDLKKEQSHDEMSARPENMFASSATMAGELVSSAMPSREADQPNSVKPSTGAHMMPPPPVPASSAPQPFPTAPTSTQVAQKQGPEKSAAVKPTPAQRQEHTSLEREITPETDDTNGSPGEPHDQIVAFDWGDLDQRYHHRMIELDGQEGEVMKDFDNLCQYFSIWANAGSNREVDRSFKRLKTQTTYVQHEEAELEQKRLHYIRVVDAFKSALALLKQ